MDKSREVKKILRRHNTEEYEPWIDEDTKEICQLFEPKADVVVLKNPYGEIVDEFPRPDNGRLLDTFEIGGVVRESERFQKQKTREEGKGWSKVGDGILCNKLLEAQDAKTSRIKDAECQERVKRIFKEVENGIIEPALMYWLAYPEDRVTLSLKWQDFKKREGIE